MLNKTKTQRLETMLHTIGSAYSPCALEEKEAGKEDIWKAWGRISEIQTMLAAILAEGIHKRDLPLSGMARMLSSNPGRIVGLYPGKGSFLPGSNVDFTVVDLEDEWTRTKRDLHHKNPHSPLKERSSKSRCMQTIVHGETIYQEDTFPVDPGHRHFFSREYSQI